MIRWMLQWIFEGFGIDFGQIFWEGLGGQVGTKLAPKSINKLSKNDDENKLRSENSWTPPGTPPREPPGTSPRDPPPGRSWGRVGKGLPFRLRHRLFYQQIYDNLQRFDPKSKSTTIRTEIENETPVTRRQVGGLFLLQVFY